MDIESFRMVLAMKLMGAKPGLYERYLTDISDSVTEIDARSLQKGVTYFIDGHARIRGNVTGASLLVAGNLSMDSNFYGDFVAAMGDVDIRGFMAQESKLLAGGNVSIKGESSSRDGIRRAVRWLSQIASGGHVTVNGSVVHGARIEATGDISADTLEDYAFAKAGGKAKYRKPWSKKTPLWGNNYSLMDYWVNEFTKQCGVAQPWTGTPEPQPEPPVEATEDKPVKPGYVYSSLQVSPTPSSFLLERSNAKQGQER